MGVHYNHLTEQDRVFLRVLLEKKYSKAKIANILKVSPSTIYREIKRNRTLHWCSRITYYWPQNAHAKYLKRRKKRLLLEKNAYLREYVHSKLKEGWSPYQIEGRLKREHPDQRLISHETIYHYIYSDPDRRYLFHSCLRRKHRYRLK